MRDESYLAKKIEDAVGKGHSHLKYHLDSENKRGELYLDGEKPDTPDYSFTEISDIIKKAYDSRHPISLGYDIGFGGETFVSTDDYELEIYATGSMGIIEYTVRKKEAEYGR